MYLQSDCLEPFIFSPLVQIYFGMKISKHNHIFDTYDRHVY